VCDVGRECVTRVEAADEAIVEFREVVRHRLLRAGLARIGDIECDGGREQQSRGTREVIAQLGRTSFVERPQDGADVFVGEPIEQLPLASSGPRELDEASTSVARIGPRRHEPISRQILKEPARIAGVEAKPRSQLADRRAVSTDFVEQPGLAERSIPSEELVIERADALGEQPAEISDRGDGHGPTVAGTIGLRSDEWPRACRDVRCVR
jgi:hypothetical protein